MRRILLGILLLTGLTLVTSCEKEVPACEANRVGDVTLINEEYTALDGGDALGAIDFFSIDWNGPLYSEGSMGSILVLTKKPAGPAYLLAIWDVVENGECLLYWSSGFFEVRQCELVEVNVVAENGTMGRMAESSEQKNTNFTVISSGKILKSEVDNYAELKKLLNLN
jgi:hypothetical protein